VRQAFLRADRRHDLGVRIELDAEAPAVPVGHRQTELREAFRQRVSMVGSLARRFDELLYDVRRGRPVGVAHAEVDDVFAGYAGAVLELDHLG
jgi:hypothetical protein